jgi:hypothetical protein
LISATCGMVSSEPPLKPSTQASNEFELDVKSAISAEVQIDILITGKIWAARTQ